MAITIEAPVINRTTSRPVDLSRLSRDEIDAELQAGWDDFEHGRTISLAQSIKNYNRRHRR